MELLTELFHNYEIDFSKAVSEAEKDFLIIEGEKDPKNIKFRLHQAEDNIRCASDSLKQMEMEALSLPPKSKESVGMRLESFRKDLNRLKKRYETSQDALQKALYAGLEDEETGHISKNIKGKQYQQL